MGSLEQRQWADADGKRSKCGCGLISGLSRRSQPHMVNVVNGDELEGAGAPTLPATSTETYLVCAGEERVVVRGLLI